MPEPTCDCWGLETCPECSYPLTEHVGRKTCLPAVSNNAKNIWDLPIFGWAWKEDGKRLDA